MLKAVIVGINEYPKYPLSGCVNDANDVVAFLTDQREVAASEIRYLIDADATKKQIVAALLDLIKTSTSGDTLLFHYSGHGSQLPSQDVHEPDGLDETLCPFDFDFDDLDTALTDNEIQKLIALLPAGVTMTIVLDSCHSGDSAKALREDLRKKSSPRFMPPPKRIQDLLKGKKRLLRKRGNPRALVVSACRAEEEAADTTFSGRANGAFTYHWLKELEAQRAGSVSSVVKAISPPLASYDMHPELDGPAELKTQPFVLATYDQASGETVRAPGQIVFDESWSTHLMGMQVGAEVRISVQRGGYDCQLIGKIGGGNALILPMRLDGNTSQSVDLMFGFKLIFSSSRWSTSSNSVDFDLTVQVVPPSFPFLPFQPVTLVQRQVTLPSPKLSRALVVPASPADLLALIQLSQMGPGAGAPVSSPVPSRASLSRASRGYGDGENIVQLDDGRIEWGPNWREDRLVEVGFLRQGQHRRDVTFGGQQGQGNVYFVRWASDDETNGDFIVHIGNHFFGGWGSTRWYLQGWYSDITPFPRGTEAAARSSAAASVNAAPRPHQNGKAKAMPEELEMEAPEAGGSIRA